MRDLISKATSLPFIAAQAKQRDFSPGSTAIQLSTPGGEYKTDEAILVHDMGSVIPVVGAAFEVHRIAIALAVKYDARHAEGTSNDAQKKMCNRQIIRGLVGLAGGPVAQIGRDVIPKVFCNDAVLGSRTISQIALAA